MTCFRPAVTLDVRTAAPAYTSLSAHGLFLFHTPLSPFSSSWSLSPLYLSLSLPALLCRPDPVAPPLPATLHLRRAGPRRRRGGARAHVRRHKGMRRCGARWLSSDAGRERLRAEGRHRAAATACGSMRAAARGCAVVACRQPAVSFGGGARVAGPDASLAHVISSHLSLFSSRVHSNPPFIFVC